MDRVLFEIKRETLDGVTFEDGNLKIEQVSSALKRIRYLTDIEVKTEFDYTAHGRPRTASDDSASESDPQVWAIKSENIFQVKTE